MTDDEIDALWMRRTNLHNGELMPQLRDFAGAVLAARDAVPAEYWIEYDGNGMPVPGDTRVDTVLRDGETGNRWSRAKLLSWLHTGAPDDIMRYRVCP